jgi:hypothetical protein
MSNMVWPNEPIGALIKVAKQVELGKMGQEKTLKTFQDTMKNEYQARIVLDRLAKGVKDPHFYDYRKNFD